MVRGLVDGINMPLGRIASEIVASLPALTQLFQLELSFNTIGDEGLGVVFLAHSYNVQEDLPSQTI